MLVEPHMRIELLAVFLRVACFWRLREGRASVRMRGLPKLGTQVTLETARRSLLGLVLLPLST